jgi:hypothetical protein
MFQQYILCMAEREKGRRNHCCTPHMTKNPCDWHNYPKRKLHRSWRLQRCKCHLRTSGKRMAAMTTRKRSLLDTQCRWILTMHQQQRKTCRKGRANKLVYHSCMCQQHMLSSTTEILLRSTCLRCKQGMYQCSIPPFLQRISQRHTECTLLRQGSGPLGSIHFQQSTR